MIRLRASMTLILYLGLQKEATYLENIDDLMQNDNHEAFHFIDVYQTKMKSLDFV